MKHMRLEVVQSHAHVMPSHVSRSCAAAAPAATKAGTRDCHARYHDPEYGHTLWYGMSPSERAASVYPKL